MSLHWMTRLDCDGGGCNEELDFAGSFSEREVLEDATNFYHWGVTLSGQHYCPECKSDFAESLDFATKQLPKEPEPERK